MANIHDVAKAVGVSIGTVSRAFCNRSDISEATRDRVLEAARNLNYKPYAGARNMRRRRDGDRELSFAVGLLFFGPVSLGTMPFMGDLTESIENSLSERGIMMSIMRKNPEGGVPRDNELAGLDGIICCGWGRIACDLGKKLPTIIVDFCDPDSDIYAVVPDYRGGVRNAVERLLKSGRTRIATLCGYPTESGNQYFANEVWKGFEEAHHNAGVQPKSFGSIAQSLTAMIGYEQTLNLFSLTPSKRPDAIIAPDGVMLGVYRAAYQLGLRIPNDISLVGIDGIVAGEFYPPPLTSVDVKIKELGDRAVQLLMEFVNNGHTRRGMEFLTPEIIVRESALI